MINNMMIRIANEKEINLLITLWIEKSKYLEQKKIKLWNIEQFNVINLKEKYVNPQYFICYIDSHVVGGFILIDKDLRYWPEETRSNSFYFHKFMVCNGFNGLGLSKRILDWVKDYGKQNGKSYIRLDYDPTRQSVEKIYLDNGFRFVENAKDDSGKMMVKAEYKLI